MDQGVQRNKLDNLSHRADKLTHLTIEWIGQKRDRLIGEPFRQSHFCERLDLSRAL
ncbi:MAG: hypothetical protein RLZZ338_366 [Cyanobacteriota bacterium]|jgi:hypothetical protein